MTGHLESQGPAGPQVSRATDGEPIGEAFLAPLKTHGTCADGICPGTAGREWLEGERTQDEHEALDRFREMQIEAYSNLT